MRKSVFFLTAACISLCISCRPSGDSYTMTDSFVESAVDKGVNEKKEMIPEEWRDRLSKTVHITVSDVFSQMYEPELQAELTDEEVRGFISLGNSLELSEGNLRMERFCLVKGEALEAWRNKIEREHGIIYSLLSRAPGKEYFSLLSMAASGHLSENTEDPAMEGVEYDLSEKELHELMALESGITTDSERAVDPDIYYMLNIYDENGAGLYSFSADREGRYLCNQYPVSGKGLEAFFHELEKRTNCKKD